MSDGHGEKLSRKANLLMLALLTSNNLEDAASVAGVSVATARRWYRREDFQSQFKELQGEITDHSLRQLKGSLNEALNVLRSVMNDAGNSPSARVSAARTILDNGFKALELSDVLSRLEVLERKVGGEEA